MTDTVAIIDYGSGNLRSAAKAFERAAAEAGLDYAVNVTAAADDLTRASHVVLPGVGAFADCKAGLAAVPGMMDALEVAVRQAGKPFLGICVGMQLMANRGLEHGSHKGFGWIAGDVAPLTPTDPALKIPHMGWNDLIAGTTHPVLAGIETGDHAYFVHSYAFQPTNGADLMMTCDYGGTVTAVVGRENMIGTQFHPEKSQQTGFKLITNFLHWRP
jgi:glutamine amidotransferase